MTRIQFFGDMAATGFGTVTMDLGRALLELGDDVRFVSQNAWTELPEPFGSRTYRVRPGELDPERAALAGESYLAMMMDRILGIIDGSGWEDGWRPEAAIILGDFVNVRVLVDSDERTRAAFSKVPTFHYVPIEGVDLPPSWGEMWKLLRPVAMSRFGAQEIAKVTGHEPPVVYHGVDTEQFRPVDMRRPLYIGDRKLRDKAACRKLFGIPADARIMLRTDRNMPRKRFASLIRAVAPVIATRPDAALVLHCRDYDEGGSLPDILSKFPPMIRERVAVTNGGGGLSRDELTALYNLADVYVSTSAEGFGLTIAEALACGTPAVGLAYSAVPEVIGPGGYVAPVAYTYDNEYSFAWAVPDERAFGQAVAYLLDNPAERREKGRAGAAHVRTLFSWQKAAVQFSDLIREAVSQEVAA